MTNFEALKKLAAVVCGVEDSAVTGSTISEVLTFIAENYPTKAENELPKSNA